FYALVDLKGDPTKTPDVFIVPSKELNRFLEPHPIGVSPASGKLTDVWCVIYNKDAPTYRDKWDTIIEALAKLTAFGPIEEIVTDGCAVFHTSSVKCQNVPVGLDAHLSTAVESSGSRMSTGVFSMYVSPLISVGPSS
ncbi:unnamed protein product, partial [marine sediment metagenome]